MKSSMWKPILLASSAFLAAATGLMAPAATAQELRPTWASPQVERRGGGREIRPVREIIESVRRQVGGEFVSVQTLEQDGEPPFYVLRWRFSDGATRDLRVNAVNGNVMGR